MEQTLVMLSRRASFENTIPEALYPYHLYQEQMDSLFVDFFGDEVTLISTFKMKAYRKGPG